MQLLFNEQLFKSQLEIQEQTFNTISMEIHDNVGQVLSLLKVQLNIIDQKDTVDKVLIADAKQNVGKAMTDLRNIANSLNTTNIQLSSLTDMVQHELKRMSGTGLARVMLNTFGEEWLVKNEKKLIIFRMIQECFQNIVKHAQAESVTVNFTFSSEDLKIEIIDNGIGFDLEAVMTGRQTGLGLQNLTKRAAIIGGQAGITSKMNEGTKITIITPYA